MAEEAKEQAPKKSRKGLIIVGALALLLSGAGGGYFFLKGGKQEEDPRVAEEAQRKKDLKSKVFVNLEPFTVNLAGEDDRFAQVAIVLEVASAELGEEIKTLMPAVRNKVLLLLSGKEPRDLMTVEGKELLAEQVALHTLKAIGRDQPAAKRKVQAEDDGKTAEKDADGREEATAPKAQKVKAVVPQSPIKVHFSQFIVQ